MAFRKLGEFIKLVDIRNSEGNISNLLGVSISKEFMPSVANIIGTDLTKYKIISKGQFACSLMQVSRDGGIAISLYKNAESAIMSPAYFIFEVSNSQLNSDYLELIFNTSEFDRAATFYAVGGVRGTLTWDDFCKMEINVPDIAEQERVVKIYNVINNRIKILNALNKNLEEQAQTIFKHWFIDFEFPNEEGQPYKSSGGKMIWNEELQKEIPEGWKVRSLADIANYLNGLAMQKFRPKQTEIGFPVLKIRELKQGFCDSISEFCSQDIEKKYIINNGDVIFSWSGSLFLDIWCGGLCGLNQHLFKVTSKIYDNWFYYFWTKHHLQNFIKIANDMKTTMGHIKREELSKAFVLIPPKIYYDKVNLLLNPIFKFIIFHKIDILKLAEFRELLLPKLLS